MAASILALDYGTKRIGLAIASDSARLARPLTTLDNGDDIFVQLKQIIAEENITRLVIGLPRGLSGQTTAQTEAVSDFTQKLGSELDLPIDSIDEAVTSEQAEAELKQRGKPYQKGDIDALAATYILEDWLSENKDKVI